MNNHLFAVLALAVSAPFVTSLDPGADAPAPAPAPAAETAAPTTTTPAPAPTPVPTVSPLALNPRIAGAALKQPGGVAAGGNGGAAGSPALSSLVAEAIKRKLDRVAAGKTGSGVEVPIAASDAAALNPPPQPVFTPQSSMPLGGPGGGSPEAGMMTGGARVMMGSPTDGSPSHVRVAVSTPDATPSTQAKDKPAQTNPLAPTTDPMEVAGGVGSSAAASEPGPKHNLLDIFIGTWDVSANFDTGPGQPPETANGQMVNAWQLDGRWLKQEYSGQMASLGSFRGLGFLGYDNLQKTYVGTWMDTLSTSCFVSKGAFDDTKATFTLTGDFTVDGGEKYTQKQVMTVLSPDRYIVTMYLTGPDGVEFKTGNLEYSRSSRKVSIAPSPAAK